MGIENTAGAVAFWNHEVASATGAACDLCVENGAKPTPANATLGDEHRLGGDEKATRPQFSPPVQVSRDRARDRLSGY
jgi:hypothetical protein